MSDAHTDPTPDEETVPGLRWAKQRREWCRNKVRQARESGDELEARHQERCLRSLEQLVDDIQNERLRASFGTCRGCGGSEAAHGAPGEPCLCGMPDWPCGCTEYVS